MSRPTSMICGDCKEFRGDRPLSDLGKCRVDKSTVRRSESGRCSYDRNLLRSVAEKKERRDQLAEWVKRSDTEAVVSRLCKAEATNAALRTELAEVKARMDAIHERDTAVATLARVRVQVVRQQRLSGASLDAASIERRRAMKAVLATLDGVGECVRVTVLGCHKDDGDPGWTIRAYSSDEEQPSTGNYLLVPVPK